MKRTWIVFIALTTVLALAACVAALVLGPCQAMIDCGTTQIPMKCKWSYAAVEGILGGMTVMSAIGLFLKEAKARQVCSIAVFLFGAVALLVFFVFVGVCASSDMLCAQHRPVVSGVLVASMIVDAIAFFVADDEKMSRPKAQL